MKTTKYLVVFIVTVFALVSISQADAAICVAKPDKANASITLCLTQVTAGDVIKLETGIFTDSANGGYEVFPITMKAGVAIVGEGKDKSWIYAPSGHAFIGDSSGVRMEGITVESNTGAAVYFDVMSTPGEAVFKNSDFITDGLSWSGIHVFNNTEAVTVDGCTLTGPHWVIDVRSNSPVPDCVLTIVNSTLVDNADGWGEGAISPGNLEHFIIRNTDVIGWPNETMQGIVYSMEMDNVRIANNASLNIWGPQNMTGNVEIRNSKIGYNTTSQTYLQGTRLVYRIINTQMNLPITAHPYTPPVIKMLNCYDSNLTPIPNQ